MKGVQRDYQKVYELSRHARLLEGINSLLNWDQETYMPPGGAEIRSEQMEVVAGLIHREQTGPKLKRALSKLIDLETGKIVAQGLEPAQEAAVKEWRRDYLQNSALPSKFVEKFARVTSQAATVWKAAKREGNFHQFAPFLDRIIGLCRQKADYLGYKEHPYDALLNEYEPDMTTKQVAQTFGVLREALKPLIKKVAEVPVDDAFLFGSWDQDKQIAFSHQLLSAMGYDLEHGRLDFSSHPFSSASHPSDSRITTRIHPTSLVSNIFVILHEGGHALYEMGLPEEHYGSPLGTYRSLGIHESQSRWWETRIGLSRPFWHHFYPSLQKSFDPQLKGVPFEKFYRAINKVTPSFIRVEADELTYPLHVILRFEMEKELIEGSLNVRDIPEVWNAKMEESLGITPQTNREGCLQDIHWAWGGFGYFPTYTLGNLYAAHLFDSFEKEHPEWESEVESGKLGFIKLWLHNKIYQHGRRYPTQELLKLATGHPFSPDAYLNYLEEKYTSLFLNRKEAP